jgi:FkbM family methyltransferase
VLSPRERIRYHAVRYALRALLRPAPPADLVRLGSDYGGWWVPEPAARSGAIAYCAGVGEDITFDIALHARGCDVVAIDPVPRAAAHVHTHGPADHRFTFYPYGLASSDGVVAFFPPRDPRHVSYSMTNLQGTTVATDLPVRSLRSLMLASGHDRIDILKLDIEGAEYEVLARLLTDGPLPPVLCVEFDQPTPLRRTVRMARRLTAAGYRVAKVERFNVTFLR